MLKKILCIIAILGLFSFTTLYAKPLSLNEVMDGVCRISTGSAIGSGTCIKNENNKYYILTSAHVVGNITNVRLEFFKAGRKTQYLPGTVVWKRFQERTTIDFAIVSIDANLFGDYPPRVIPIVGNDWLLQNNTYICSAGFPQGKWVSAWEGSLIREAENGYMFYPPPLSGQSGSGLLTHVKAADGEYYTKVVGVVTWRVAEQESTTVEGLETARGIAIPIKEFYNTFSNTTTQRKTVPANYIESAEYYTAPGNSGFALGSDGKYYRMIYYADGSVDTIMPYGTKVIKWDVPIEEVQDCPDGTCPNPNIGGWNRTRPQPRPQPNPRLPGPTQPNPNLPLPTPPGGQNPAPNTPNKPYGDLPDFIAPNEPSENVEKLKKELEALKVENANLKDAQQKLNVLIDSVTEDRNRLYETVELNQATITSINAKLDEARKNYTLLGKENEQLTQEKLSLSNQIIVLQKEILTRQTLIERAAKRITEMEEALTNAKSKVEEFKQVAQEKLQEISESYNPIEFMTAVVIGGAGISLLAMLALYFWRKNRSTIKKGLDRVEDIAQSGVSVVIGEQSAQRVRDFVENMEKEVGDLIDEKLAKKAGKSTQSNVAPIVPIILQTQPQAQSPQVQQPQVQQPKAQIQPQPQIIVQQPDLLNNVQLKGMFNDVENRLIDHFETRLSERVPTNMDGMIGAFNFITPVSQPVQTQAPVVEIPTETPKELPTTPQGEEYAKQLFGLKTNKDGQSIYQWAMFAQLYRDAVQQLRKGGLYYDGKTRLYGQAKTADAIDGWVRNEFLKRVTTKDFITNTDSNKLYFEALLGFLYMQAIAELRQGRLDVLGAEDTATAVQKWVEKEFLRRMGYNF